MSRLRSSSYMWVGVVLLLLGTIIPFLMITKLLQSTFLLNFIAFVSQVLGLALGLVGLAMKGVERRASSSNMDEER